MSLTRVPFCWTLPAFLARVGFIDLLDGARSAASLAIAVAYDVEGFCLSLTRVPFCWTLPAFRDCVGSARSALDGTGVHTESFDLVEETVRTLL